MPDLTTSHSWMPGNLMPGNLMLDWHGVFFILIQSTEAGGLN